MNPQAILSNTDYQRLKSTKVSAWTDQELALFLVWDFVNAFGQAMVAKDIPGQLSDNSRLSAEKYKKYQMIFDVLDATYALWLACVQGIKKVLGNPGPAPKKVLFLHFKWPGMIDEAKKHYAVTLAVEGKKDRLAAMKSFIGYVGITQWYQYIADYVSSNDIAYLRALVAQAEEKLIRAKPDMVVMGLDVLPIERAVIVAAQKLGIKTVVVQHGLQDVNFPLLDCKAADDILVWGQAFKDLWVAKNDKNPEHIYILGYPYVFKKDFGGKHQTLRPIVCYLGQDFEKYNKDLLAPKIKIIQELSLMCRKMGLEFLYRLHPGDNREMLAKALPDVTITPLEEPIEQTFDRADIFVSFSSTVLISTAIRGKISLQLMNYPIQADNFEKLGVCQKSFATVEELTGYLKNIITAPDVDGSATPFNNDYIETRLNPNQRFVEILQEIERKSK